MTKSIRLLVGDIGYVVETLAATSAHHKAPVLDVRLSVSEAKHLANQLWEAARPFAQQKAKTS